MFYIGVLRNFLRDRLIQDGERRWEIWEDAMAKCWFEETITVVVCCPDLGSEYAKSFVV